MSTERSILMVWNGGVTLPKYVIERDLPGACDLSADELQAISRKSNKVLAQLGVGSARCWLSSVLAQLGVGSARCWLSSVLAQLGVGSARCWLSSVLAQLGVGSARCWLSSVLAQLGVGSARCWLSSVLAQLGPEIVWLTSYVTDDKIYCEYVAPDADIIGEHARCGGVPAARVTKVSAVIDPSTAG